MLNYLGIRHNQNHTQVGTGYFNYVKNNVIRTVEGEVQYNRFNPLWIAMDHLLIQFLITLENDIHLSDYDYYDQIRSQSLYVGSALGFTSSINTGILHSSFYGQDKEIVIGEAPLHRVNDLVSNWKMLEPVKVIRHDYNVIDYQPIIRKDEGINKVKVILVDFIKLAFQYKYYILEEERKQQENLDIDISIRRFLYSYPLNNLLYSHVELCLMNAMLSGYQEGYIEREKHVYRTANSYKIDLEKTINQMYPAIYKQQWDIGKVLGAIPTLYHISAVEWSEYVHGEINRQNSWAYLYAFLPILKYSLILGNNSKGNTGNRNNIFRTLERLENDNVWGSSTINTFRQQVKEEIREIENLL